MPELPIGYEKGTLVEGRRDGQWEMSSYGEHMPGPHYETYRLGQRVPDTLDARVYYAVEPADLRLRGTFDRRLYGDSLTGQPLHGRYRIYDPVRPEEVPPADIMHEWDPYRGYAQGAFRTGRKDGPWRYVRYHCRDSLYLVTYRLGRIVRSPEQVPSKKKPRRQPE